jgi:hypothetical protein
MPKRPAKHGKNACYTSPAPKKPPKGVKVNSSTKRRVRTDFLFASPSVMSGVARLVDFGCSFDSYNNSSSPAEADARALVSDWYSVGDDIASAVDKFREEESEVA